MPVAFLPFGAYSPGGSAFGPSGLDALVNALPLYGGIHPMGGALTDAGLTAGPVTGSYGHFFPASPGTSSYVGDQITVFTGTKSNLYTVTSSGFTAVSKGGGYATAVGAEPAGWRFASFGNDIYAANGLDVLQRRTANAGNFADGPASTFIPEPRFVATVREFLVVADLSANAGRFADEIAWSDVDDPTWWDPADSTRPTSLAGAKRILSSPGQITGLVGGSFGIIFKRNSIHSLQFTAGPDVWRIDELSGEVGTTYPSSIVRGKGALYFWGGDAFYRQAGLSAPEKISPPEINEALLDGSGFANTAIYHAAPATQREEDVCMFGAQSRTGIIFWFYRNDLRPMDTDRANVGVAYNPETQAWSFLEYPEGGELNLRSLLAVPHSLESTSALGLHRLIGFTWDGTSTRRFTLVAGASYLFAKARTKKVSISLDGANRPCHVRIRGVLPQFTMGKTTDFEVAELLSRNTVNSIITVTASNTPTFAEQLDADGTVIDPRSETYEQVEHANDKGWFPHNLEGTWWQFQVQVQTDDVPLNWTTLDGIWIWYEVLGQ